MCICTDKYTPPQKKRDMRENPKRLLKRYGVTLMPYIWECFFQRRALGAGYGYTLARVCNK